MRLPGLVIRNVAGLVLVSGAAAQTSGFYPIVGGLPFDAGLALGVGYQKTRLVSGFGEVHIRAIGSTKSYEHLDVRAFFPRSDALFFAEAGLRYRNYPEEDFWGLGPDSAEHLRTTFRQEDVDTTGALGISPWWFMRAGVRGGSLNVNTGPGKDEDRPSIEQLFGPDDAPALDQQPDFWHYGAFIQVDYRDEVRDPARGGLYLLNWTRFRDRTVGRYDFSRWNFDLRQFFPSVQRGATVAARVMASFSRRDAGDRVPFWMQPTAGGGGDVRGYLQYRFRDENMFAASLEHRWRVHEFLQLVAFADAGRVFPTPGDFGLSGMRGSVGVGGRVRLGQFLIIGLDMAWSPENLRFWFRGSQMF
jgi:hypothetical protein